jgi:hypothetical protein
MRITVFIVIILFVTLLVLKYDSNEGYTYTTCAVTMPNQINPSPSTQCAYGTMPPSSVIPHGNLPDGTPVLICGHPKNAVPDKWSYPKQNGYVAGTVLSGSDDNMYGFSKKVKIGKAADQLLYITGLIANKKYLMTFNDLEIPVWSDENGIILFDKYPLPTSALPYVNMYLHIPYDGIPVPGTLANVVNAPNDDYSVIVEASPEGGPNTVSVTGRNILRMVCEPVDTVRVWGVYRILLPQDRDAQLKKTINMKIGNADIVVQNGTISMK